MQLVYLTLWGKIDLGRPRITFFFLVHTGFYYFHSIRLLVKNINYTGGHPHLLWHGSR